MDKILDVGKRISILDNLIKRYFEANNSNAEITGMQGRILHYLMSRTGESYSKDIEKEFRMRRATVSGYLINMENNGVVIRVDVPEDKRLKKIILTDKARSLYKQIIDNIRLTETKLLSGISDSDINEFLRIITLMQKNMNE